MGPIQRLLPGGTPHLAAADLLGTTSEFAALAPSLSEAEQDAVRTVAERRRADYAAARVCARTALAGIGVPPAPILNRNDRSPIWPAGVVGSLTHTSGYAAAVVALADVVASIGIDAEPDVPLPPDVTDRVLTDADRALLAELPPDGPSWDRLLFCIKEATYKTWFPLMHGWLGFEDVTITLTLDGDVRVMLLHDPLLVDGAEIRVLTGRWAVESGFLGCALVLDRLAVRAASS